MRPFTGSTPKDDTIAVKTYYLLGMVLWTLAFAIIMGHEESHEQEPLNSLYTSIARQQAHADARLLDVPDVLRDMAAKDSARFLTFERAGRLDTLATTGGRVRSPLMSTFTAPGMQGTLNSEIPGQLRFVFAGQGGNAHAPDTWELEALQKLAKGESDVTDVANAHDSVTIRFALPLRSKTACRACHSRPFVIPDSAIAGISYLFGPIRNPPDFNKHVLNSFIGYATLWVLGLAGMSVLWYHLQTRIRQRRVAEEIRRRSELLFREVWVQSLEGMRLVDGEGTILLVNDSYCSMVRKTREELEGKPLSVVYEAETGARILDEIQERLVSGTILRPTTLDLPLWDGRQVCFGRADAILDIPGEGRRLLSIFHDLAERLRAEGALRASEEKYRSLHEMNVAGVYRSTQEGVLIDCNEAFAHMMGFASAGELVGQSTEHFYFEKPDRDTFVARLKREGTLVANELLLRRSDGTPLWILENVTLVGGGAILGTMIDITRQKQIQAALAASENRLVEVKSQLQIEAMRMQIAADLHDDIGSTVSSTSIFSSILRKHIPSADSAALTMMERIDSNLHTIQESLHDIVWSVNPDNDDLDNTLLRIQEYAAEVMEARGIALHISRPDIVQQFPLRTQVRRSLYLISKEAIKNIVMHAHCTEVRLNMVVKDRELFLMLKDNGIGFDPAAAKGNGIVNMRRRVNTMGGSIDITTAPGKGTYILIRLPIA